MGYPVIILVRCYFNWIKHIHRSLQLDVHHIIIWFNLMAHELVEMFSFKIRTDNRPRFFNITSEAALDFVLKRRRCRRHGCVVVVVVVVRISWVQPFVGLGQCFIVGVVVIVIIVIIVIRVLLCGRIFGNGMGWWYSRRCRLWFADEFWHFRE